MPNMLKAARISTWVSASAVSAETSDASAFVSVALFSGVGLLVSLVAALAGVPVVGH
jgi:hypothetical protein